MTTLADHIETTDLNLVCAFRMAAKDIRARRYKQAAWRLRSDLDKAMGEDRFLFQAFIDQWINAEDICPRCETHTVIDSTDPRWNHDCPELFDKACTACGLHFSLTHGGEGWSPKEGNLEANRPTCPDCGDGDVQVAPTGELEQGDTWRCNCCTSVFKEPFYVW